MYSDGGRREVRVPLDDGSPAELRELVAALGERRTPFPDARWGQVTLEVCLALRRSSVEGRTVELALQCPVATAA